MRLRVLAVVMTIALAAPPTAAAQHNAAGPVRGRIVDSQQQGVVAATVQAVQRTTGWRRQTSSDARGDFIFIGVPPGEIELFVRASGFAERRVDGLTLQAGQSLDVTIELALAPVQEQVVVEAGPPVVNVTTSTVGAVLAAREIESTPVNGRNILELTFLVPGNSPAPSFDPTKAQTVIVSSAGTIGRGGNLTLDGQDNNDDVVGGALQNVTDESIQELQVMTNRFAADQGRSAGSVINLVTRSGGAAMRGSTAVFVRDRRLQSAPNPLDSGRRDDTPFDREHLSATLGGPIRDGRVFGFGAVEVRNQDGAVVVGERDPLARTIHRRLAVAPLDDLLGSVRLDARIGSTDDLLLRYSAQRTSDISASVLDRALGSASERQYGRTDVHAVLGSWNRTLSGRALNVLGVSYSFFDNRIAAVEPGAQLTYPSLQDGASFRVPQATTQKRWQISDTVSLAAGAHQWKLGAQVQRVDAAFDLGVFRAGRIDFVEDFAAFDRNTDGRVDDDDLLFAVTLRSGRADRNLLLRDADNVHFAAYVQDDIRIGPRLTLNLGLRYEIDSDVNNLSRSSDVNPLLAPFVREPRRRDVDNWGPRAGFNWSMAEGRRSLRGGYGIYYDRVTLMIASLERGFDGRALPIEVRAGNELFLDPSGRFAPGAPTRADPFTGFVVPGAGASGIHVIDPRLQNPQVHQLGVGFEQEAGRGQAIRVEYVHNHGTSDIIGRTIGSVFNPVVGGPDRVVNLESSARRRYDGLLVSFDRRYKDRWGARVSYTWSKAMNSSNDDQVPFGSGPVDPNDLRREYGPAPVDRRHRLTISSTTELAAGVRLTCLWTLATGVPLDILMPSGQSRVPVMSRNAGGRVFTSAADLNGFLRQLNARGGIDGVPLPLVGDQARFGDSFNSLDLRVARSFGLSRHARLEGFAELFNAFNVVNVLGTTTQNYSGYSNALVRDSNDPASAGYLRSSRFGTPVSTAGGVFGAGGPRALQVGFRVSF